MNYNFEIVKPTTEDWHLIEASPDCTCFHTEGWFNYLCGIHRKLFVVKIVSEKVLGYFIGAKRWLGITIVEPPAVSSGTFTTGLCLLEMVTREERVAIYQELFQWLRKRMHTSYMQVSDWQIHITSTDYIDSLEGFFPVLDCAGLHYSIRSTLFVDTRKPETELWNSLHYKSCKYSINKANKEGLRVEVIDRKEDIDSFVELHRRMIEDVFDRKGMSPMPYQRKEHLLALCRALFPNRIFMLKVMGSDQDGNEQCMSTAIFCPGNNASTFFTAASFRQYMKYCPNELMVWEGMKKLHERGAGDLIFTGIASYKKKFGTMYAFLPVIAFTPYSFLFTLRTRMKTLYGRIRNIFKHSE